MIEQRRTDVDILADPMFANVVRNLIDNVIRHSGGAQKLIIKTSEDEHGMIITFEDNGHGLSEEEKRHLFELGYGKNTGFGLYHSREILKLTGLDMRETGVEGYGARFEITVPSNKYRIQRE